MTFSKNLWALCGLIALWSCIYSGSKFFYWGHLSELQNPPTLEGMTGSILLGSMIAYVFGGKIFSFLGRDRVILFGAILTALIVSFPLFLEKTLVMQMIFFIFCSMGFFYGLYVIGKNMMIGEVIHHGNISPAIAGASTTSIFIVFVIVGSILGALLGESSFSMTSIAVIVFALFFGIILLFRSITLPTQMHSPGNWTRDLIKKYFWYLLAIGCFWEVSLEASQVALYFAKEQLGYSNTAASILLVYSSIGAIAGNILSAKLQKYAKKTYIITSLGFVLLIFGLPFILEWCKSIGLPSGISWLSGAIGMFFGCAVNLTESLYLAHLGTHKEKEALSGFAGFTLSGTGAIIMFSSEYILHHMSLPWISFFLGLCACIAVIGGYAGFKRFGREGGL